MARTSLTCNQAELRYEISSSSWMLETNAFLLGPHCEGNVIVGSMVAIGLRSPARPALKPACASSNNISGKQIPQGLRKWFQMTNSPYLKKKILFPHLQERKMDKDMVCSKQLQPKRF